MLNKPKLVLHIGHAKTGTTSIQDFLAANTQQLLELGYLYPVRRSPRNNHVVLRAGFMKTEDLDVHDYQVYEGDTAWFVRDFKKFIAAMEQDIEKFKPHTVILSAEQMFRDFSSSSKVPLALFLSEYFSDVLVVVYIKSPIANFWSSLAQSLRTGVNNLPPEHRPIMNVIEYYESQFPGAVRLHAFERQQLVDGDVLADFMTKYLPEAGKLLNEKKVKRSNVSLSWPLLLTLRKLRVKVQPDGKKPLIKTRMLLSRVAKENQKRRSAQSSLKPELKSSVSESLVKSARDFLWLKQQYGVAFSDLDYEKIKPDHDKESIPSDLEDILDLSNIDTLEIDVSWYQKRKISYYLSNAAFVFRLRTKRMANLYLREVLSLRRKFRSSLSHKS